MSNGNKGRNKGRAGRQDKPAIIGKARLSAEGALRDRAEHALDDLSDEQGFMHGSLTAIWDATLGPNGDRGILVDSIEGSGDAIYDEDAMRAVSELMDDIDDWRLVLDRLVEDGWETPKDIKSAMEPRDMYIALVYGASLLLLEESHDGFTGRL